MNYNQCAKTLLSNENILLLTHNNPDGDTVASAAALCSALRRGGRTAYLFPNPQIIEKLLPYAEQYFAPEGFKAKFIVAVDVPTAEMLSHGFSGKVDLCIDHHPTNSMYAKETMLKGDKSSCGEIVLELIKCINTELTAQEATLLYIALSTDTGCFQYSNTKAASFRAAEELLRLGADNHTVNQLFFRKVSIPRLRLEGLIYSGMRFYRDGKISVAIVTKDMMAQAAATEDDCDDLAGLAGRAETSCLNITIREKDGGNCKISMRSSPEISSSDICAVFGGGGHSMAAGCTIQGSPDKVIQLLLQVIDEVWK